MKNLLTLKSIVLQRYEETERSRDLDSQDKNTTLAIYDKVLFEIDNLLDRPASDLTW